MGLTLPASVLVFSDPSSTAILANIWVKEDPGSLPAASSPSNCILLSNSLGKGGVLPEGAPARGPSSCLPLVLLSFSSSEMEQPPVKRLWLAFQSCTNLFILMLTAILFWTGALIGKCQKSGAKSCIFWSRWTGSSKRL